MANVLSKSNIITGEQVDAWNITQSIDAFTGEVDYDITVSGSFTLTGSLNMNGNMYGDTLGSSSYSPTSSYALNVNLLEKLNYNPFQFNNDEIGLEKYCLEQKYKFHMINCEILNVKSNTDLNTYKSCETLKKANLSCEQLNTYFNYLDSI